jgi:hypothetical protein
MKCPAMEMCLEISTLEVWQVQTQNSEKVLQVSTNPNFLTKFRYNNYQAISRNNITIV